MKDMAGNGIVAAEINIAEIADTGRPDDEKRDRSTDRRRCDSWK